MELGDGQTFLVIARLGDIGILLTSRTSNARWSRQNRLDKKYEGRDSNGTRTRSIRDCADL